MLTSRKHTTRACDGCRTLRKRCEYESLQDFCKRCIKRKKFYTFLSDTKKRGRKKIPFYEKPSGDPIIDAYMQIELVPRFNKHLPIFEHISNFKHL
ncbi:11444_t:CDS:1, partial [Acaulospora morrowiae]